PHIVRMLFGTDHNKLIPLCALVGAVFLIWADVLCRIILPKTELPIGVLIALVGAPFFVYIMTRKVYHFGSRT
ncbi:MAG: iron chelate uptake ABC transporter family permease subunit, partial [Sporomusa sp.]